MRKDAGKIMFNKAAIIGMGLMGGSLGLELVRNRIAKTVTGIGRDPKKLKYALSKRAAHNVTSDMKEGVKGADIVIIGLPVDMIAGVYKEIKGSLKKHAVVTDMGSVKKAVIDEIKRFDGCESFIGSHPMVGSERTGVKNMRPFLYAGGTCVITPRPGKEKNRLLVEAFWRALGMRTVAMTPAAHDAAVSLISHFPHLNGFALVKTAESVIRSKKGVIGPGFRDTTRIAASSGEIWAAITLLNKKEVVKNIRAFTRELKKLERYILKKDRASLVKYMNRAAGLRKSM